MTNPKLIENEEALEAPKAPRYEGLCYMSRWVAGKPQILCLNAQKYKQIYINRGFEQISHEEFKRLIPIVKGIA